MAEPDPPSLGGLRRASGSVSTVLFRWSRSAGSVLLGALYFGGLYALFVQEALVPPKEVLFGKAAREISSYVSVRFATEIARIGRDLAIAALLLGAMLGLVAHALLAVRDWLSGRARERHP